MISTDKLVSLVEEMAKMHKDMYNKIEFLEKRIDLIEKVDAFQDEELDKLWELNNDSST